MSLTAIINLGESETIEFKKSTAELEGAFKTVCAFLNGKGGAVVIGVKNNGAVVGQLIEDSTKKDIAAYVKKIEPHAQIEIKYPKISEKKVILIEVNPGGRQPYTYDGRAYQRNQSTTERMSQPRYEELLSLRNPINHSWEKFFAQKDYVNYLDHDELLRIARKSVEAKRLPEMALREEIPKLLERLHLLQHGNLTNAAVVLLSKKIMPDYPQCQLKLACFKGVNQLEFLDNNIIYGNAFELLEEAMSFVRRNLPVAARIEPGKLERTETPLIPFIAIREAMINALCHRSYNNIGGAVGLAIYSNRMEIFNDGGLPHGMTIEQLKRNPRSNPRNPIIADIFYRCALIEKYGSGIERIILTCQESGNPEPEFISNNFEFKVVFKFPDMQSFDSLEAHFQQHIQNILRHHLLSERQKEILEVLFFALNKTEGLKLKDISEKMKEAPSERQLRRELKLLKDLGVVSFIGKAKKTSWILFPSLESKE